MTRPPVLSQPPRGYRYSLEPFLLAGFCSPRPRERILELGAGSGVIGALLARRHPTVRVTAVELQPELARHAAANARAQGLTGRLSVVCADVREAPRFLPPEHFHRVVANPPFRRVGSGRQPPEPSRAAARHELSFRIADLARVGAALVRFGGALELIHLTERLAELFAAFGAVGLEPKLLRHVVPFPGAASRLCLLSARKGARPGLQVLPQLVVHERPGTFTGEVLALLAHAAEPDSPMAEKPQPGQ